MELLNKIEEIFNSQVANGQSFRFSAAMGLLLLKERGEEIEKERLIGALRNKYHSVKDSRSSNFSALLFSLIRKADLENRKSLEKGFPEAILVNHLWDILGDAYESKLDELRILF